MGMSKKQKSSKDIFELIKEAAKNPQKIVLTEAQKKAKVELQKEVDYLLSEEYLNYCKNYVDETPKN